MKNKQILRAMAALLGAIAVFLAGCCSSQLPVLDHPRLAPGVVVQDVTFYSAALNRQMPYRVFLPEKLDPGRKLPVVYLLHGGNGSFRDWSNIIRCSPICGLGSHRRLDPGHAGR
ncbi:MAG: alpha/beta hydrolase-fold protein [Terracidiphilus sp.]